MQPSGSKIVKHIMGIKKESKHMIFSYYISHIRTMQKGDQT